MGCMLWAVAVHYVVLRQQVCIVLHCITSLRITLYHKLCLLRLNANENHSQFSCTKLQLNNYFNGKFNVKRDAQRKFQRGCDIKKRGTLILIQFFWKCYFFGNFVMQDKYNTIYTLQYGTLLI